MHFIHQHVILGLVVAFTLGFAVAGLLLVILSDDLILRSIRK